MKPHEYNTEERLVAANEEVKEHIEELKGHLRFRLTPTEYELVVEDIEEIVRHSERAGMLKAAIAVQDRYKQEL